MTEFLKEFFQTVGDRIKNRVFGPFLITFLFWNWKPVVMILASNKSIEYTIEQIEANEMFSFWNVFFFPLLISYIYSSSLPYLNNGLDYLTNVPTKKRIQSTFVLKGARLDGELSIASKSFQLENAKAGKLELEDLNNKIDNLQKSNEKYIKDNEEMRNRLTSLVAIEPEYKILKDENSRLKNSLKEITEMTLNNDQEHLSGSLDLVNSELQKGNFKLDGIPNSFIQNLLDHEMIKIEKINDQEYLNFTDKGRRKHLGTELK
ncbi:hypothetical protein [Algoriphagus terrigena]|uniref:hypothetical protein n=1 Tax=Algoriphagus terrigena TaxID=344884 RepID=UPI0004255F12|nr:hypothetical protein [Algoriphagus terrigena]